jgi:type III secretory pathway component EscR
MATLRVETCVFLDLRFKSIRVTFQYDLHDFLPFLVTLLVAATIAITIGSTAQSKIEAITVKLQTLGLFAITTWATYSNTLFISHLE